MSENIAEELANLKQLAETQAQQVQEADKRAQAAETKAAETHDYMENLKRAAIGEVPQKQKNPNEVFVDNLLTNGATPVRSVVQEELQKKAYFDTLATQFQKDNPHLKPMQDEVFVMTNNLVNNSVRTGQPVSWDAALKAATDHYNVKHRDLLKISGANASPAGFNPPASRYAGCEVDYFEMSDSEFKKQVMDKKDSELKKRQRDRLSYYGTGR